MKQPQRIFTRRRWPSLRGAVLFTVVAALSGAAALYLRPWDPVSHLPPCDQEQVKTEVRTLALLKVAQRAGESGSFPDTTDARLTNFSEVGLVAPGDVPSGRDCAATLIGEDKRRKLRYRILPDPETERYSIRVYGL